MRGGGAQGVHPSGRTGVTVDLLSEWTDPDTAMEAVGNCLGVFDREVSPVQVLRCDEPLRASLQGVLRRMVDGGTLDTRGLADGRCAFRWRADIGAVTGGAANSLVAAYGEAPGEPAVPAAAAPAPPISRFWFRMFVQTAPLLLPAVSCVLALLAFLWLDASLAFLVTALLAVVGVVGVVRRIQAATFWMIGLVIAGLLVRFS